LPTLQHFLEQKDLTVRVAAAAALIGIGTPACIPLLQQASQPEVTRVVHLEAGILQIRCRAVDKIYTPPIVAPEDASRLWHLAQLATSDPLPENLTGLLSLSPDDPLAMHDEKLRARAKAALVEIGPPACGVLRELLSSYAHYDNFTTGGDFYISSRAADILQQMGQLAVPCLIDALCDYYPHTRLYSAQALRHITGQSIPPDYGKWSKWFIEQKRNR